GKRGACCYRGDLKSQHFSHCTAAQDMGTDLIAGLLSCVGQNVRPLNKREYILDIATEAEPVDGNYSLWFRRVVWSLALKLDNELYVTMHYNQVHCCCLS
ncbi:hypothetical protein XENOCAPTIV_017607, partial [Xenoophorus captivus]